MELSEQEIKKYCKRLLLARTRMLCRDGFFGMLLVHMTFTLTDECQNAATDGRRIFFDPQFLAEINNDELDFVLRHEILHVVFKHAMRAQERNNELFNLACDIVVNSHLLHAAEMDQKAITLQKYGVSLHHAPDGTEGYEHTAEEVYAMLVKDTKKKLHSKNSIANDLPIFSDDHRYWGTDSQNELLKGMQDEYFMKTCESVFIQNGGRQRGILPLFAQRMYEEMTKPQVDWRVILHDFIQEENVDYSFNPPDKRFADSPFFLPALNEKDEYVKNILFMIDTSGSMSDEMIAQAYAEVKNALAQFTGKLQGYLGFFDARVTKVQAFETIEDLNLIKPIGGGGTDFFAVFDYVAKYMADDLPLAITILTDGYADFPPEEVSLGIPVLWLINNDEAEPPWGKVTRIML